MQKFSSFFILSLLSVSHLPLAYGGEREDFKAQLKLELQSSVKTFARPVSFFHYGKRGNLDCSKGSSGEISSSIRFNQDEAIDLSRGATKNCAGYASPVELNAPEALAYFQGMTKQFALGEVQWAIGPGLYASIDPVQSESYADYPWFLLEITVPPGLHYLDLGVSLGLTVSTHFGERWKNSVWLKSVTDQEVWFDHPELYGISIKQLLRNSQARQVLVEILNELNVDAVAYPWSEPSIGICAELQPTRKIGFNFMNAHSLEKGLKLQVLVQSLGEAPPPQKILEYRKVSDLIESAQIEFETIAEDRLSIHWDANVLSARRFAFNWARELGLLPFLSQLFPSLTGRLSLDEPITRLAINPAFANIHPFQVSGKLSVTVKQDPIALMKQVDPGSYQQRLQLIKDIVFACNPDYPAELN